jgi:hypothetical protein
MKSDSATASESRESTVQVPALLVTPVDGDGGKVRKKVLLVGDIVDWDCFGEKGDSPNWKSFYTFSDARAEALLH